MRTGAGIDALGDYGVNPMSAEIQMIMQQTLSEANRVWMEVQKGYYGDKKFTCILGLAGSAKVIQYTPNKDFKDTANVVAYVSPGADENKLAVAVTQLAATEIISRHTARVLHPMVNDEDEEEQFVTLEKMNDATLAAAANEIAQGSPSMTTAVVARAAEKIAGGMPMYRAFLQATAEAATQAPAPGAEGGPAPGAPPGAPPGSAPMAPGLAQLLASQGAGAAPPGTTVPAPNPDLMSLRHTIQGISEQMSPGAT
jgi:hypothetical protein